HHHPRGRRAGGPFAGRLRSPEMRLMLPLLLLVSPFALAADYGEPMPEGEAIAIADAAADPAAHTTGEPAKFSGRITQVCQKKGCWVVLEQDGASARVMAK